VEEPDPSRIEESDNGKVEAKTLDDSLMADIEELDDDGSEEKQVDERPYVESPGSRSQVGELLASL